jgi:hypothetical protein
MSRYDDDYRYGRDYAHGSDGTSHRNPRVPSPGHTTYNGGASQAKLAYEPQGPFYPPEESPQLRPRSFLPPIEMISRASSRSRKERDPNHHHHSNKYDNNSEKGLDWDSDDSRGRTKSPLGKARKFVGDTFTDSTTGISVGVLGALVGGLAAREAADYRYKGNNHHHDPEHKRNQLISTVVGAAVGALGANAIEKRIENHRARDEVKQERWERKWRPGDYTDGPDNSAGVEERREVLAVARPRSKSKSVGYGGSSHRDSNGGRGGSTSRRGIEREVDLGARSWKNVEEWVLDGRNGGYPDGYGEGDGEGDGRRDGRPRSCSRSRGQDDREAYRY